jgi:hypothetical protein
LRRQVLAEYRGYPDRGVFTKVPEGATWQRVLLTPAELSTVRCIRWDWWLDVTNGSRNPADALHYYRDHPVCRTIANGIMAGRFPPQLIIAARPGPTDLVVLEGHLRLTAMIMVLSYLPAQVPALLGTSPDMDR